MSSAKPSPATKAVKPAAKPVVKPAVSATSVAEPKPATKSEAVAPAKVAPTIATKAAGLTAAVAATTKTAMEVTADHHAAAEVKAEAAKFEIFTPAEHARVKGMWAGAMKRVEVPHLFGLYEEKVAADPSENQEDEIVEAEEKTVLRIREIEAHHTPALLKSFDELMVNASDHERGCRENSISARVTEIAFGFDRETCTLTFYNNGPGIPVVENAKASAQAGRPVYIVEVAMAWFLAGTNLTKDLTNVKGGINGLGAKLANVNADVYDVETVDMNKKYYTQRFRERLRHTDLPTIIDLRKTSSVEVKAIPVEDRKPHTKIKILPAYKDLGYIYSKPPASGLPLVQSDMDEIEAWLRLRSHEIAAYCGPNVRVLFNGAHCKTTSAAALARLRCTQFEDPETEESDRAVILQAPAKAVTEPYDKHPWDLAVIVLPNGVKKATSIPHTTIVNGVMTAKGAHITYLKKLFSDAVVEKIDAATKKSKTKSAKDAASEEKLGVTQTMAMVRIVATMPLPGADWGGQRKDELGVETAVLKNYTVSATFLKRAAALIAERVLSKSKRQKKIHIEKYTKARAVGAKSARGHLALLAAEGDSALRLLKTGLAQNKRVGLPARVPKGWITPSYEFCGTITLQGVIVNAIRETTELETTAGDTLLIRTDKLRNNKVVQSLFAALGIDPDCRYATEAERAKIKYDYLIGCVDQDLDGCGKILSLLLVLIYMLCPALIEANMVGRWLTPVIRVYPKRGSKAEPLLEFHYEAEAEHWMRDNPGWESRYQKPRYYKGLAGHDEDEVKRMFTPEAFNRSIYLFTLDDGAKELFNIYFGKEAALRKEALSTPVAYLTFEEAQAMHRSRVIPCSSHLAVDTKAFKLEAVRRQIPHIYDKQTPAQRKIMDGGKAIFRASRKELKVYQFGGRVAAERHYHHGDASLNGSTIRMAQCFPFAKQFPYLEGVGQFGSRHSAAKNSGAGSARYIGVRLCRIVNALYPDADRWLLPFTFEEGERSEPVYWLPIVPMNALESMTIPSEAWNHDSFARDFPAVMLIVEALLRGETALSTLADRLAAEGPTEKLLEAAAALERKWRLPVSQRDFKGEVRQFRGEPYSFGSYWYDAATNLIHVTELPIGTVTETWIKNLTIDRKGKTNFRKEFLETVDKDNDEYVRDLSGDLDVDLEIQLKDGMYEKICEDYGSPIIDPIEDFLGLRESLRPHLNYVGPSGAVLEFGDCYLAALLYWFPARRDLYRVRLEREQVLLELRILEQTEILRYVPLAAELDLASKSDDDEASAILTGREFPRINSTLLHSPQFTEVAALRHEILEGGKISHDYILNLPERQLIKSAVLKRQERLSVLKNELSIVLEHLAEQPFAGVSIWRAEISAFKKLADEGIASRWRYKKPTGSDEDDVDEPDA
jgi:DNA topoisomerase II